MVDTKTLRQYQGILALFMTYDHVHSMEVLAAITPNDVLRYMNLKTFGTEDPPGDANPTARCTCKQFGSRQKSNLIFHAESGEVECNENGRKSDSEYSG